MATRKKNVAEINTDGSKTQKGTAVPPYGAIDGTSTGPMAQANQADQNQNVTPLFKQEDPGFMQKLKDGADKIAEIAGQRKELNAKIAEVMASFENDGLNRHAVKAAIKYIDMNETDQQNYDLSYTVMRKALGQPVQGDLFEAAVASELKDRMAAH